MNSSFINGSHGDSKSTPLHVACNSGNFQIVLYLLEENAPLNVTNIFGNTPFFIAVINGYKDICKVLSIFCLLSSISPDDRLSFFLCFFSTDLFKSISLTCSIDTLYIIYVRQVYHDKYVEDRRWKTRPC